MIENWFSVPVYYTDLAVQEQNQINSELVPCIDSIRKTLGNPWGDTVQTSFKYAGSNLIREYDLDLLEKIIASRIDEYLLAFDIKTRFSIKESWINFSNRNCFQFDHQHFGFELSAVYYYQTNEQDGDLVFVNPNPYKNFMPDGNQIIKYRPKQGRLIMFPAWLTHRVESNQTDNERISLTFNIKLGV